MRNITSFLCILFIFSCENSPPKMTQVVLSNTNILNEVVYPIDNRTNDLDVEGVEDILSKKYFTKVRFSVELQNAPSKNISVFLVKLTGSCPTSLNDTYTFIDFRDQHLQFLLPIEYNQFYKIDNQMMVGGFYSNREFDYYFIYELNTNFLKLILDTRNIGGEKIRIGYYTDEECVDYIPDRLNFQYNMELQETHFSGLANVYCSDGKDRTVGDKVVKKTDLHVILRYHQGMWTFDKVKSNYLFQI